MVIISYPWRDNPLEYLVSIEFPLERTYRASGLSLGSMRPAMRDVGYLKRAAKFREELQKIPRSELLKRAEAAAKIEAQKAIAKRDAEESQRFFNLPSANTEIAHWSRMSLWSLDEAVSLSLGKDPRRVNWENVRSLVQISAFAANYQARREIILRAKLAGQLWDSTIPGVFLAWAERMNVEMPPALVDAIKELGVQIGDWKTAFDRRKIIAEKAEAEIAEEKKANIKLMDDHIAYIEKLGIDFKRVIDC